MRKPIKPIGEILVDLGLITPEHVERGLARQREHGGRLGDALISLGIVTRAEVEWGLADQYDLPFVQLRPDAIDQVTAAQVPPAWAREHMVLPVLRNGETVTVIVADPRALDRLDEIREFTGARAIEASLASEENILELIQRVEGIPLAAEPLERWLQAAMRDGARQLAISVRGEIAMGWDDAHPATKSPLDGGWLEHMARRLTPSAPPADGSADAGGVRQWSALLDVGGERWTAVCRMAGSGRAWEWMLSVGDAVPGGVRGVPAADALRSRVVERRASGSVVRVNPGGLSESVLAALLPALPLALLGPTCRAAHLTSGEAPAPAETLLVPAEPNPADALAALASFRLDAVSIGAHDPDADLIAAAGRVAPLVVFAAGAGAADLHIRLHEADDRTRWILDEERRGTD